VDVPVAVQVMKPMIRVPIKVMKLVVRGVMRGMMRVTMRVMVDAAMKMKPIAKHMRNIRYQVCAHFC
jgi:hypothetical protein